MVGYPVDTRFRGATDGEDVGDGFAAEEGGVGGGCGGDGAEVEEGGDDAGGGWGSFLFGHGMVSCCWYCGVEGERLCC